MGTNGNIISLGLLKTIYELVAFNLKRAQMKCNADNLVPPIQLKICDSVLLKDHTAGPFDPIYIRDFHIISIMGNQVECKPLISSKTCMAHISEVKYILSVDRVILLIPDQQSFGHKTKLFLNPDHLTDLGRHLMISSNTMFTAIITTMNPKPLNSPGN